MTVKCSKCSGLYDENKSVEKHYSEYSGGSTQSNFQCPLCGADTCHSYDFPLEEFMAEFPNCSRKNAIKLVEERLKLQADNFFSATSCH